MTKYAGTLIDERDISCDTEYGATVTDFKESVESPEEILFRDFRRQRTLVRED